MEKKNSTKSNTKSTKGVNNSNVKKSVKNAKIETKDTVKKNLKTTANEKKTTKKVNTVVTSNKNNAPVQSASNELRKLSVILISIVGIICIFYIITVIVTKNNGSLKYQISDEISQISYTDILAADILSKNGTYYVLVKDSEDYYVSLYETYISSYISLEEHLPVYIVDLNDALNQYYKAEQNDFSPENLKFRGTTLLKVSDNTIESIYEDSTSINEHLKSLVIK